ncbi:MAG TPA: response regulator transcription factor [Actinomycetota bacterium]|nr:response regulator transcription factor [Actinomycetota bacterium]
MRRTILVVEDEEPIARLLEMYLDQAGYRARVAPDAKRARSQLDDPSLALVLLDLSLPDGDGIDLFREIRRRSALPVIMVTARDAEADRVLGLELGADDYVTKPFSPRELVARVRGVLRRGEPAAHSGAVDAGGLRLDPDSRDVTLDSAPVDLTRKEFDLLAHLLGHPGRVWTRSQLLEAVWGYPDDVDSRTVDVHVAQLRRKLGSRCPVRTVRGVGYKAEMPS